jgi:hypothetical protein
MRFSIRDVLWLTVVVGLSIRRDDVICGRPHG